MTQFSLNTPGDSPGWVRGGNVEATGTGKWVRFSKFDKIILFTPPTHQSATTPQLNLIILLSLIFRLNPFLLFCRLSCLRTLPHLSSSTLALLQTTPEDLFRIEDPHIPSLQPTSTYILGLCVLLLFLVLLSLNATLNRLKTSFNGSGVSRMPARTTQLYRDVTSASPHLFSAPVSFSQKWRGLHS